jgi:hypothetical protein
MRDFTPVANRATLRPSSFPVKLFKARANAAIASRLRSPPVRFTPDGWPWVCPVQSTGLIGPLRAAIAFQTAGANLRSRAPEYSSRRSEKAGGREVALDGVGVAEQPCHGVRLIYIV